MSLRADLVSPRLTAQLSRAWRLYDRAKRALSPSQRKERIQFDRLRDTFYRDFWNETASAVGAVVEPLGYGYLRIARAGRWTLVRRSEVMLDDHLSLELAGNKPLVYQLLAEYGLSASRHCEMTVTSLERGYEFLRQAGDRAVVVKPASGTGAGHGVTTGIRDAKALERAAQRAAAFCSDLLIEEEVDGASYRLLYLDGELIDAIRRDSPTVTGDGKHTIAELIASENRGRLAASPIRSLHPIGIDMECRGYLGLQGKQLDDKPAVGERIAVKRVVNENAAPENHRVLEQVHPRVAELGTRIVKTFGLSLVGIDLITTDINAPLEETGGVMNELNTTPGLSHHVLVAEPAKRAPVGESILEYVFAESGGRPTFPLAGKQVR
jgi:cyanophycin synthetase